MSTKKKIDPTKPKKAKRSNGAKTNAVTIAAKIKAAKALELRKEGLSFEEIAQECKYNSKQAAYDAVKRALDAVIREPATDLIRLDLERLDVLFTPVYLKAQAGDTDALSAALKIMERRAKMLGFDAAVKVNAVVDDPKGVLVAGAVLSPEAWAEAAAKQQADLQRGSSEA